MVARKSPQSILAEVSATLASSLAAEDILATVARQIGEAMSVFPMHPRTRKMLEQSAANLKRGVASAPIDLTPFLKE